MIPGNRIIIVVLSLFFSACGLATGPALAEEDTVAVIPLTVTAKGVLPLDRLELFAGAGLGLYFTALDGYTVNGMFGYRF